MARTVRPRPSSAATQEILRVGTAYGALRSRHTPGQLPDPQLLLFSVESSSLDLETQARSWELVRAVGGAGFRTVSCPPHLPPDLGSRPPGQSYAPHPLGLREQTPGMSCAPHLSLMAGKTGPRQGGSPSWWEGDVPGHVAGT